MSLRLEHVLSVFCRRSPNQGLRGAWLLPITSPFLTITGIAEAPITGRLAPLICQAAVAVKQVISSESLLSHALHDGSLNESGNTHVVPDHVATAISSAVKRHGDLCDRRPAEMAASMTLPPQGTGGQHRRLRVRHYLLKAQGGQRKD